MPSQYRKVINFYPDLMQLETIVDADSDGTVTGTSSFQPESTYDFAIVYKAKKEKSCLEIFFRQVEEELGLKIKKLTSSNFDKNGLVYGLISAPREVLAKRAEKLKISIPLHKAVDEEFSLAQSAMKTMKHYFSPCLESGFFKIPYDAKYENYINASAFEGGDPFTSSRIRIMLIHDLLKDIDITAELREKNPASPRLNCDEYRGLRWLEKKKFIEDSFALHSREEVKKLADLALSKESWYKYLSLTSLRNYFGEKIGLSFAWRSAWLSNALGFPILFGIITMIYGLAKGKRSKAETLMFGNAVEDKYLAAMNNELTPYYALLMCVLAAFFPKRWSVFKYIYSFKWGTINYFLFDEREIVKFAALKERSTLKKGLVNIATIVFSFFSILIGVVYCLFMIYIQRTLTTYFEEKIPQADVTVNAAISLVNTILVNFVINPMFEQSSLKLTEWERHHFDSDFERALTARVFFNSFFNNNIRILMMLIVPRFDLPNIFTNKTDSFELCKEGQCSEAIGYQVAFFLLLRPIMGMFKYFRHTITVMFCKRIAVKDEMNRVDRTLIEFVEKQRKLFCGQRFGEKFTTMDDMNARIAQYGFVVMFAAAFPLAPIIAFVMEYLSRRADIDRYLKRQRRPIPRRQEGIGSWEDILEFVNVMAICTNVWIIAFRSNYGFNLIIDWKKFYPNDYQAMLSMVLISSLVLLTSLIRAVTHYNTIPERVKVFQREEEKTAKEFLNQAPRRYSSRRYDNSGNNNQTYVAGNTYGRC